MMKVKVQVENYMPAEFEISESDARLLVENSLVRVLNTAADVAFESTHGHAHKTADDLDLLRPLATRCWHSVQQAVLAAFQYWPTGL